MTSQTKKHIADIAAYIEACGLDLDVNDITFDAAGNLYVDGITIYNEQREFDVHDVVRDFLYPELVGDSDLPF